MSVIIRLYNSGCNYKDFEGESEECIKSMPEFQEQWKWQDYSGCISILKKCKLKHDYIILEGNQGIISDQIVDHLNKGYEIQATHVASYGGDNDWGYFHIVHLIKKPIN